MAIGFRPDDLLRPDRTAGTSSIVDDDRLSDRSERRWPMCLAMMSDAAGGVRNDDADRLGREVGCPAAEVSSRLASALVIRLFV
jgi:hypothetical protein